MPSMESVIKAVGALVAVGGLLFGIVQFSANQAVEAAKPFLERKLAWCEEAVEVSARIAVADVAEPVDVTRFWQLYWGVMGMVEGGDVTQAMIDFGTSLKAEKATGGGAIRIAHACRDELARDWSPIWRR